jgi:hypothetical protein
MGPEPGHEQVLTTFMSYGKVATGRQGEIIREIGLPRPSALPDAEDIAEAVARKLRDAGRGTYNGPYVPWD